MGKYRSHLQSFALLPLLAAQPAAADADLSKLRKPGGYVIVSDKDGKAISGAYWLLPNLKIVIHSEGDTSLAQVTYVDREFFPRLMVQPDIYMNIRTTYDPEPSAQPVGKVVQIKEGSRFASSTKIETRPVAFAVTGLVSSKLQNIDIVSRHYGTDGSWAGVPGRKAGQRVYIETLDVDLSAADAANVAAVETGEAASTGDFHALYFSRGLISSRPEVATCFRELRLKPEFQAAAKKQRETADRWMTTSFLFDGKSWWDRKDFSMPDWGPALTSTCPDPS